ncbi:MAG: RibD family protein [Pseudomonadota bacterium]
MTHSIDPHRKTQALLGVGGASFVIGQIGQSLDGRVAARNGESKYINGKGGLTHLHRLRAAVDAVIVGAGTVIADDPSLTVRFAEGANPVRVLIDPTLRVPRTAQIFRCNKAETLTICRDGADLRLANGHAADVVAMPAGPGNGLDPADILDALAARGLGRVLIEGGPRTLSIFLESGLLDRLHVIVAPVIMGAGPGGISLDSCSALKDALRPDVKIHDLGGDVLYDCAFETRSARRDRRHGETVEMAHRHPA